MNSILSGKLENKLDRLKGKSGFTLIELIVVLMILAILVALLMPKLVGWIDEAMKREAFSEAHFVLTAAQSSFTEAYAKDPDASSYTISIGNDLNDSLSGVTDKGSIAATKMFWNLLRRDYPNLKDKGFESVNVQNTAMANYGFLQCKNVNDEGPVLMPFTFVSKNGYTVRVKDGEIEASKNSAELQLIPKP